MAKISISGILRNLPFKLSNSKMVVSFLGRKGKTLQNYGHDRNNPGTDLDAESTARASSSTELQAESHEIVITIPAPDNPNPERNVIPVYNQLRGMKRFVTHLINLPGKIIREGRPHLSQEEIAIKEKAKADKIFLEKKIPDMRQFAHLSVGRLTKMGFMNVEPGEGKKRRVNTVRPAMVVVDRLGTKYTMSLNIENLPSGVMLTDLVKEETMTELIPAVGIPVKGVLDVAGVRIIGYPSGQKGLPIFVPVSEMWEEMPKSLPMLSFPVGVGENGNKFYKDLDDCPHLLVVGGSKQGKSNLINVILCTYLKNLKSEQVKFVLFDLKRGMEFCYYEGVPHLLIDQEHNIPGIVDTIEQAIPAMRGLMTIMEQRMDFIKAAGFKNINDYNAKRQVKNRLAAIVIVFDEYAQIGLEYGELADKLIANLSNMARAAGIYILIGSQYPRADVLTTLATINFQVRIAFNMTGPASNAMIGSQAAAGMECRGRAILMDYDKQEEIQTPRITDSTIKSIVKEAIEGKPGKEEQYSQVDIEEILDYAILNLGGSLEIVKLFAHFRKQNLRQKQLKIMLKAADDKTFTIRGTEYIVTTAQGRFRKVMLPENLQIPHRDG